MKLLRFISIFSAALYIIVYLVIMIVFLVQINNPPDFKKFDAVDSLMTCFIAYNLIFDWLGIPVSILLIWKEITMEFFQFLKHNAGEETDDVSLHLLDILDAGLMLLYFMNPLNWFYFVWNLFMGRLDFGELATLDPGEDESDYYKAY